MEPYKKQPRDGTAVTNKGTATMNGGTVLATQPCWAFDNQNTFNFKAGTINLDAYTYGVALYNTSGTITMTGGTVLSKGYGICVDGGKAYVSNATLKATGDYGAVLIRNKGAGEFNSTTIYGAVGNTTSSYENATIRSRITNYGIIGKVEGYVIGTTNTGAGQSQEKVTVFNPPTTRVLFPTWTDKNGQDDIVWMKGTYETSSLAAGGGISEVTIYKSRHNNETGLYNVHIYSADSNWNVLAGLRGFQITF